MRKLYSVVCNKKSSRDLFTKRRVQRKFLICGRKFVCFFSLLCFYYVVRKLSREPEKMDERDELLAKNSSILGQKLETLILASLPWHVLDGLKTTFSLLFLPNKHLSPFSLGRESDQSIQRQPTSGRSKEGRRKSRCKTKELSR